MSGHKEFTPQEIDQFRSLMTDLKDRKDRIDNAMTKAEGTALLKEERDRIIKDAVDLVDPITKRIDGIEAAFERVASGETKTVDPKATYRKAWEASLRYTGRNVDPPLPEDVKKVLMERKALSVDVDTSGGYLVPDEFQREMIDQSATEIDSIRPYTTARQISGMSTTWPTITAHAAASDTAEQGTDTPDTTLATGQVEITAHKMTISYDVSHELTQDSAFDLSGLLREEFGQAFAYKEGTWFVSGTGVTQPSGFILDSTILANYVACGTAATLSGSDMAWLPKLQVKLKERYWANAIFGMNRTTYGELLGLSDGESRSYMMPNPATAVPLILAGSKIVLLPSMPAPTTNLYPIIYGDFRRGVKIVDKVPMAMQVDPYSQWNSGNVRYKALRRVGFAVTVAEAFAVLKIATT